MAYFPKASDHEVAAEVGWILHSTISQDEEHIVQSPAFENSS